MERPDHEVEVFVLADQTVVTRPDCSELPLKVGQTIRFKSPQGGVRIDWTQNVFDAPVYHPGTLAKASVAGPFAGECVVIRPDGVELGWPGLGPEGKVVVPDEPPPPSNGIM